jgi:hypothetical protein
MWHRHHGFVRLHAGHQKKNDDHAKRHKNTDGKMRELSYYHWAACAVHLISFIVILAFFLTQDTEFTAHLVSDTFITNSTAEDAASQVGVNVYSSYELFWVLVFMPLITALFHAAQACLSMGWIGKLGRRYVSDIKNGVNLVRWIEYSITATLMTWIIAQLCGITNVFLVFLLAVVGNVVLQWHGYFFELTMKHQSWIERWSPMISGFMLFFGQWSILACYFFRTINAVGADAVPWFVYVSFFGMLGTFLLFPLVQFLFAVNTIKTWFWYELGFIILSLFSKLLLDWTLFAAIFTER